MIKRCVAVDIGASSGRHIVGWEENGEIVTEELYRFPNGPYQKDGHLYWDTERLFQEVKNGLKAVFQKYPDIASVSIDTWGVDYVLMKGDESVLPVYCYRDARTDKVIPQVHSIVPFEELYAHTGIQFQTFNTIYQLYEDKLAGRLDGVTDFLMIPEYLMYRLTGVKKKEYTNATTMGLVNVDTREIDLTITDRLGLPRQLFGTLYEGGEILGELLPEVAEETGGQTLVKLCLTHDTASAVYALTSTGPYISSGTWSLLGICQEKAHTDDASRQANFSNEGGIRRTFRYQKNIMGMWVVNNVCKENGLTPAELASLSDESTYEGVVDVNAPDFMAPENMTETILKHLEKNGYPAPASLKDLARCVLSSLAKGYADSVAHIEKSTGKTYDSLVIVGGGAKNKQLNSLTEQFSGKRVTALPIEATAIGNLKIQLES